MKRLLGIFFGILIGTAALVITYFCMRAVMAIGGYCADGGPYVVATHCPQGVDWMTPIGMWVGVGGVILYIKATAKADYNGPKWYYFMWTVLFASLGWNFLDFALRPPAGMAGDGVIGWWICAVLFEIMAFAPIVAMLLGANKALLGKDSGTFGSILLGKPYSGPATGLEYNQNVLMAVHALALVGGLFLGVFVFNFFT